jgi:rhamnogalacturonyl hydrolase YesR
VAALAWMSVQAAGRQPVAAHPPGWGVRFADAVIATWPDPAAIDPAKNGWEYNTGIVLFGMSKMYDATKDPRYLDYIKRWVDGYVNDQGVLGWDQARTHNLDYIQPGMLGLFLYERTGDPDTGPPRRRCATRSTAFRRTRTAATGTKVTTPTRCGSTASTWESRFS